MTQPGAADKPATPAADDLAIAGRKTRHRFAPLTLTSCWGVSNLLLIAMVLFESSLVADQSVKVGIAASTVAQLVVRGIQRSTRLDAARKRDADVIDDENILSQILKLQPTEYDVAAFVQLLLNHRVSRLRVDESYSLANDSTILRQVDLTVRLPSPRSKQAARRQLALPIITPPKGMILPKLRVTHGNGTELPIIPYAETLALSVTGWRSIVDALYRRAPGNILGTQDGVFMAGVKILARTVSPSERFQPSSRRANADEAVERWVSSLPPELVAVNKRKIRMATEYLRVLSTQYAITTLVDRSEFLAIRYEYQTDASDLAQLPQRTTRLQRLAAGVRRAVGVTSPVLAIDLHHASLASSYHLNISVPKGNYVASAIVKDSRGDPLRRPKLGSYAGTQKYFRRSGVGRRNLHLYCRSLTSEERDIALHIRVHEPPWGTLGSAIVYTFVASTILALMAFWIPDTDTTNIALTLVGIPVTVLGIGLSVRSNNPREKVAVARTGVMMFVLSTTMFIIGTILFLDRQAHWFDHAYNYAPVPRQWLNGINRQSMLHATVRIEFLLAVIGTGFLFVRLLSWWRNFGGTPVVQLAEVEVPDVS